MRKIRRREFLKKSFFATCSLMAVPLIQGKWIPAFTGMTNESVGASLLAQSSPRRGKESGSGLKEAYYYEVLSDGRCKCLNCPNGCTLKDGQRSKCKVREPRKGKLRSLVYGLPSILTTDFIEKCPLYHFYPSLNVLSVATVGCNLSCEYCQNWQLSFSYPEDAKKFKIKPKELVKQAKENNCKAISYFYTEPVVYYEYMVDIAEEAKNQGLKNIMVTAGYINKKPLRNLQGLIDAFVVGLKGFNENYYEEIVGGELKFVLNTLTELMNMNTHIEIVNLIVPTLNDKKDEIEKMTQWIAGEMSKNIPLHLSRFVPEYKLKNLPPTPLQTLEDAYKIAKSSGMKFVYLGNLPGHYANNTYCPNCNELLIQRIGFKLIKSKVTKDGKCYKCGSKIYGCF